MKVRLCACVRALLSSILTPVWSCFSPRRVQSQEPRGKDARSGYFPRLNYAETTALMPLAESSEPSHVCTTWVRVSLFRGVELLLYIGCARAMTISNREFSGTLLPESMGQSPPRRGSSGDRGIGRDCFTPSPAWVESCSIEKAVRASPQRSKCRRGAV